MVCIDENAQEGAFCVWLLYSAECPQGSSVLWGQHLFASWKHNIPLHGQTTLCVTILWYDGHLGCWRLFAILNTAFYVQVFVWTYIFISHGETPRSRTDWVTGELYPFVFSGPPHRLPAAAPFHAPPSSVWKFSFSTSRQMPQTPFYL